jgi:hypothetical protein
MTVFNKVTGGIINMKFMKMQVLGACTLVLLVSQPALAVPTFQVYIEGATAGTWGDDEQTWFTQDSSFNLIVAGAYGPKTVSLTDVTLLISVPKGETGTISISGGDVGATLFWEKSSTDGYFNPNADADINPLGAVHNTGYSDKLFLPQDLTLNNEHYPFQEGVSDFLLYGIGQFDNNPDAVSNYSTEEGIEWNIADGEEKTFAVSVSGFTWAHFDAYGLETYGNPQKGLKNLKLLRTQWDISPGSHDATYIPAPGAVLLASVGLVFIGLLRRRGTL